MKYQKKRETIDSFLSSGNLSMDSNGHNSMLTSTPRTVQLTPKIASLALDETTAEQDFYSLVDESMEFLDKIPRCYNIRNDLDKLSEVNHTLFQLRMQLYELQNMDIPSLPMPSLRNLPSFSDKQYYFTMDSDVVFEEEPSRPVTAKQKELEILNRTIQTLNERIDMKTKALIRYANSYDSNLKTILSLKSPTKMRKEDSLQQNSSISLTTLQNLEHNIEATNIEIENDLGRIEDVKMQIKKLQIEYNEKIKENQQDIVGLVEQMKEMKKKSLQAERRYNSLQKELDIFVHSGINFIWKFLILACFCGNVEVVGLTEILGPIREF